MIYYCPYYQTDSFLDKMMPTIVSTLVVVIIFIIGRYFELKIRKREIERNWYFKVIIEPNINKIDIFINEAFGTIKDSVKTLIQAKTEKSYDEYIGIKSIEFGKFQELLRKFKLDFVIIVQDSYPVLTFELSSFLMNIEDSTTNILDKENLTVSDYYEIEKTIKKYKSDLLILLHKPIENPAGNKGYMQ